MSLLDHSFLVTRCGLGFCQGHNDVCHPSTHAPLTQCLVSYAFGKELSGPGAGLLAAAMMSIVPGYVSRSAAGSYDNEAVSIFALLLTFWLFVKAIKTGTHCRRSTHCNVWYNSSDVLFCLMFCFGLMLCLRCVPVSNTPCVCWCL